MRINRFVTIIFLAIFFFALFEKMGLKAYPILSGGFFILIVFWSFAWRSFPEKYFNPLKFIIYYLWLGKEIIKSSWQVTKIIWSPRLSISPHLGEIETEFEADSVKLITFANSVTLTPGTYTVDIEDNKIIIHALNFENMKDLQEEQVLQKQVKKYFS